MLTSEPGSQMSIHRFYSRALKNFRSLYIYLPPSYGFEPDRRYPVLYMHDGQNIFDGSRSYSGDGWEIHQTADELIAAGLMEEILIVGIAHQNERRLSEYAHMDGAYQGSSVKGRGLQYESFLLNDVKPFIEANFRVLPGKENTGLMGSSMGGLVSFNIGLRHPEVFGKLGVLSPSFWWNPGKTLKQIKRLPNSKMPTRMWMDMGEQEGQLSQDFSMMVKQLRKKGISESENMACWLVPEGSHSEKAWMSRVHCPLLYLFGETGKPEQLMIDDLPLVKIKERKRQMLITAVYNTGFCHTPYPVRYISSRPDILSVTDEGVFMPHQSGEAVITVLWDKLEVSQNYQVKLI